ncbi:MAG: hypothetical protein MUC87_15430 [Bacteroidia bacterium]|jgi:hypothetical protein|nr:hypothetical protein [Bacteroidia bacterium]
MKKIIILTAILGTALLSSCQKEQEIVAPNNISEFKYATAEELIQAASPELYQELLTDAQSYRVPVWQPSGYFIPGGTWPNNMADYSCMPGNSCCGVTIVGNRTGEPGSGLEIIATDIQTVADLIAQSPGSDIMIFNHANPIVQKVRGIRNITTSPTEGTKFTVDLE